MSLLIGPGFTAAMFSLFNLQVAAEFIRQAVKQTSRACASLGRVEGIFPKYRHEP